MPSWGLELTPSCALWLRSTLGLHLRRERDCSFPEQEGDPHAALTDGGSHDSCKKMAGKLLPGQRSQAWGLRRVSSCCEAEPPACSMLAKCRGSRGQPWPCCSCRGLGHRPGGFAAQGWPVPTTTHCPSGVHPAPAAPCGTALLPGAKALSLEALWDAAGWEQGWIPPRHPMGATMQSWV